jgi:hypothetical protein
VIKFQSLERLLEYFIISPQESQEVRAFGGQCMLSHFQSQQFKVVRYTSVSCE